MHKPDWNAMDDASFDAMLENCLEEQPPQDVVNTVNPWKKGIKHILIGISLGVITVNFSWLHYILPAVGMILALLGFRSLKNANLWFKLGFYTTAIHTGIFSLMLVINTTVFCVRIDTSPVGTFVNILATLLRLAQIYFLCQGLESIPQKTNLLPRSGKTSFLLLWYGVLCLLLFMQPGTLIIAVMMVTFIFIIRSLYRKAKALDHLGYSIQASAVKVSNRMLVILIVAALLLGSVSGHFLLGQYPMDWNTVEAQKQDEKIVSHLLDLGFPEDVLKDLSREDLQACKGASKVLQNDSFYSTITDDDLHLTLVCVQLPGQINKWMVIQHFHWVTSPEFHGTEGIHLWISAEEANTWETLGNLSGRLLYDWAGSTLTSSFYSLENDSSPSVLPPQYHAPAYFSAGFSMPNKGQNHRGYMIYTFQTTEQPDWNAQFRIHYIHQEKRLIYPNISAAEQNSWCASDNFTSYRIAYEWNSKTGDITVIP